MSQRAERAPLAETFGGLWFSPRIGEGRAALLFMRGLQLDYLVRINHYVPGPDEDWEGDEDLLTSFLVFDYRATPTLIKQHLVDFGPEAYVERPWKVGTQSSLLIKPEDGWATFHPSSVQELLRLGFDRYTVESAFDESIGLGATFSLEPRLPTFAKRR